MKVTAVLQGTGHVAVCKKSLEPRAACNELHGALHQQLHAVAHAVAGAARGGQRSVLETGAGVSMQGDRGAALEFSRYQLGGIRAALRAKHKC